MVNVKISAVLLFQFIHSVSLARQKIYTNALL
jgi:hypothetical protein